MKIKTVIASSNPFILEGLTNFCNSMGNLLVVDQLDNGKDLLTFIENNQVEAIIIGDSLSCINELDCVSHIKKVSKKTKVMILKSHINDVYRKKANNIGVEEVIPTVQNFIEFKVKLNEFINKEYKFEKKELNKKDNVLSLRKEEILALIAKDYTNKEIAKELFISERTVESHKRTMREILNMTNPELKKYAYSKYKN